MSVDRRVLAAAAVGGIALAVVALVVASGGSVVGPSSDDEVGEEGARLPSRPGRRSKTGKSALQPEGAEVAADEADGTGPVGAGGANLSPEHRQAMAELRADLAALRAPVDLVVDPEASPADQDALIAGAIRERAVRLERMAARADVLVGSDDAARSARALLLLRDGHEAMADFLGEVPAPAYLDDDGEAAFEAALARRSDDQLAKAADVDGRAQGLVDQLPPDHPLRRR